MRLLLVEDTARLIELMTEAVHDAGWQIDAVTTVQDGVPPVKWSTFWDNFIPRYGGSKDDSQTGKGRRHSYEASAG